MQPGPVAIDPAVHTFTISAAFTLGAIVGAVACVRLVKYLTRYLRGARDDDITPRDRGEGPPT